MSLGDAADERGNLELVGGLRSQPLFGDVGVEAGLQLGSGRRALLEHAPQFALRSG